MATISVSEAKAKLTALVREVAVSGEGYVISVNGRPMAELRPFTPEPKPGRFKNEIEASDDAFASLNDAEADAWGV